MGKTLIFFLNKITTLIKHNDIIRHNFEYLFRKAIEQIVFTS